ncbi:MAG: arylesterase [Acidobacteria bacterium]|nr:arylesterase [Acidobacteriota bacterium]
MRFRRSSSVILAVLALGATALAASCGGSSPSPPDALTTQGPVAQGSVPSDKTIVIAFLGDSLTAGFGLPAQEAYPARIQEMFAAEGYGEVEVLNGGISGDTTAGGLRRAEQLLTPATHVLVVALGGNDALRGLTVAQTHDNLAAIIDRAQASGVAVLLAGMLAPTNLGEDYQAGFRGVFSRLRREYPSIAFVPFLLEGVIGHAELVQADGVHPTAEGARVIAALLYPRLRDIIDQLPPSAR